MAEFRMAVASASAGRRPRSGWYASRRPHVVLSRLLGPADIGLVALALAFLGVLGVVADLGAATFLVQTRSWDERTRSTTFWTTLGLSLAATALVVVLAAPLAELLGERWLGWCYRRSRGCWSRGHSAVRTAMLQRDLRFGELALGRWR